MSKLSCLLSFITVGLLPVPASLAAPPASGKANRAQVAAAIERAEAEHPCIIFPPEAEEPFLAKINDEALYGEAYENMQEIARGFLTQEPVALTLEDGLTLNGSRDFLRRVQYYAFLYRLNGEARFLRAAEREMLAAAALPDWNPDHFLTVAELTAGMALGYDWLYHELSPDSRQAIRRAIIENALKPGLGDHRWVDSHTNWNQVCHSGLTLGALAVMKHEPELASRIIQRAVSFVPIALAKYEPHGAYPEGPTYWGYGTGYTCIMIEALDTALGESFGLKEYNGFMQSADYYLHVCGPTGAQFNYCDAGPGEYPLEAMPWFAREHGNPGLMWNMRSRIRRHTAPDHDWKHFPLTLLWAPRLEGLEPPASNHWHADGLLPVSLHRSGWDREATFFGTRAGPVSHSHSHMDLGSFVLEARGIRWVLDPDMQSYSSIREAGIDNWDYSQLGDRWQVFRNNNFSHSTLVVDGRLQHAAGAASFLAFSDEPGLPHSIVDLTGAYTGQLAKAHRGLALVDGTSLLVRDEIQTLPWKPLTTVRWAILTGAEVAPDGNRAILSQDGKSIELLLDAPPGIRFEIYPSNLPPAPYDMPNPGTRLVGFTLQLPPATAAQWSVRFLTDPPAGAPVDPGPLAAW